MTGLTWPEVQVLSQYSILSLDNQKQLDSYLNYLLVLQCRAELSNQLLQNKWFQSNLFSLQQLSESENTEDYCQDILSQIERIQNIYSHVFEATYDKYAPVLSDSSAFAGVLDWITLGLKQISEACRVNQVQRVRLEIHELLENYKSFFQNQPKTKVRAM